MSLLTIIVTIVIIGVVMWLINAYVPMEARLKQILNVVVIIFVLLWILFGVTGGSFPDIRVGG